MPALDENLDIKLHGLLRHGSPYVSEYDGRVHLSLPERLPFVVRDDSRTHVAKGAENCFDLAKLYYNKDSKSADKAEIIAQFQEDPILDLSTPIQYGRVVIIPSEKYIQFIAYGDSLTEYPEF